MVELESTVLVAYVLTIVIIFVKFGLGLFLLQQYRKNEIIGNNKVNFMLGMSFFIFGFAISRAIYFYYDFYLTGFDPQLLYIQPNITYWKIATFLGAIFSIPLLYVVERDIYQFKTKRILVIGVLVIALFQLLFPVTNEEQFKLVSTVGLFSMLFSLFVPIGFFYLAKNTSGQLRRISLILAISIILYGGISALMSEDLLAMLDALVPGARLIIIIVVPIGKVIVLLLITYATMNFQI